MACDKRGEAPAHVARGGSLEAHKQQNESQDLRRTRIPGWTQKSTPLAPHSLSRSHSWLQCRVGRVQIMDGKNHTFFTTALI